jgi:hypothetical protein
MGDRCYLQVIVANSDVPRFIEGVKRREDWSAVEVYQNYTQFVEHEANYAMYDELLSAAQEGCLFYGYHGSGDDYGPGEFFGADRTYSERQCGHDGGYVVETRNGDIKPEEVEALRTFLRDRANVKQRVANPLYDLVRGIT